MRGSKTEDEVGIRKSKNRKKGLSALFSGVLFLAPFVFSKPREGKRYEEEREKGRDEEVQDERKSRTSRRKR